MREERSDELKGFYRHYVGAKRQLELTDRRRGAKRRAECYFLEERYVIYCCRFAPSLKGFYKHYAVTSLQPSLTLLRRSLQLSIVAVLAWLAILTTVKIILTCFLWVFSPFFAEVGDILFSPMR